MEAHELNRVVKDKLGRLSSGNGNYAQTTSNIDTMMTTCDMAALCTLLALCVGNHQTMVVSPHSEPVMRKVFPCRDVK